MEEKEKVPMGLVPLILPSMIVLRFDSPQLLRLSDLPRWSSFIEAKSFEDFEGCEFASGLFFF
jgi:hypothetical protein